MKEAGKGWEEHFRGKRSAPELFAEFEMHAKGVSTEVFRVKTRAEAQKVIADLIRPTGAKKAVSVDGPLQPSTKRFGRSG